MLLAHNFSDAFGSAGNGGNSGNSGGGGSGGGPVPNPKPASTAWNAARVDFVYTRQQAPARGGGGGGGGGYRGLTAAALDAPAVGVENARAVRNAASDHFALACDFVPRGSQL
jgi:hypothetical protein